MGKSFYIETFGCQMNVLDSEKMSGTLQTAGFIETDDPLKADLIVFNTCSIREKAEQKFFSRLGRFKLIKKRNPNLKIAVAGCIAQQQGPMILRRSPFVDMVLGPQNIHLLAKLGNNGSGKLACDDNTEIAELEYVTSRKDKVKALVTIMYGCNNYCSYCVVPYTRGPERSRPSKKILAEINKLTNKGYKEVTLLGQNVNSYRSDIGFPELLYEINKIEALERIRFVTSHPKDLSDDLIIAMRDLDKVCEHIHLPLQSGSSSILKHMNRRYTYDNYLQKIIKLRSEMPRIAITADIISGFPQETEDDHSATLKALEEVAFDGIFAFKYSPRSGTAAIKLDGHVDEEIKSRRLNEIIELQNKITDTKNKLLEGTTQQVLIDYYANGDKSIMTGRTSTNKIVNISYDGKNSVNGLISVRILKANRHSLDGELIV